MSDVYQPATDAAPEAPAETVHLESKEAWRAEALRRGMPLDQDRPLRPDEVAELASEGRTRDDLLAKEMSRDLNRQREREGRINDLLPLVEIKAPRGVESWKSAEALTKDTTFSRRLGTMKDALDAGYDPQTAEQIALKDGQFEPTPVPLVKDNGQIIPELGRSLTGQDEIFDNVYQATRALRNGRAAVEAQLQADLAQYQQAQIQGQPEPVQNFERPTPPPEPESAPPPEQPQVDPLAAERQALAVQYQIAQLSAEERRSYDALAKIGRWANQNAAAIAQVARDPARNPKAYAQIKQVDDTAKAWKRHLDAHEQSRVLRENALAQYAQADAQRRYSEYKEREDARFAELAPEMGDPGRARDLRNDVTNMFRDVGFKDEEVDNAWQGREGFALRDHRVQLLIRDAALWRRAQARANQVSRRPLPAPMAPGFVPINRTAEANHESIASLQKQLETATGRRAYDLATKLTQAKRSAGQL